MPKAANYDRIPEPKPSIIIMTPLNYDKATESALYCWFSALLVIESSKKSITNKWCFKSSSLAFITQNFINTATQRKQRGS